MDDTLQHTPFFNLHKKQQARFAPFAGWEMPIQYADGAIAEHKHVRAHIGVFDTSHLGRFEVQRSDAAAFLDYALSSDILRLDTLRSDLDIELVYRSGEFDLRPIGLAPRDSLRLLYCP